MKPQEIIRSVEVNRKAEILTIKGKPRGKIVREYEFGDGTYISYYWVRLKDGTLIKDLSENEIEIIEGRRGNW